jgi:hypothetical protein
MYLQHAPRKCNFTILQHFVNQIEKWYVFSKILIQLQSFLFNIQHPTMTKAAETCSGLSK